MARVRLFAGLRDAAGVSEADIPGSTVAEVLAAATDRFGASFSQGLDQARVWVNGEEADLGDTVRDGDEVALLPPVSGGSQTMSAPTSRSALPTDLLLPAALAVALVLANLASGDAWWAAAVVGVVGLWAGDVAATVAIRGGDLPLGPALFTVVIAIVASHLLGPVGFALGLVAAVVGTLAYGVASDSSRMLQVLSPAMLLSLVAGSAVGSLYLVRTTFQPAVRTVGVFLAVAVVSTLVGLAMERMTGRVFADPFSATALAAVATSLIAAAWWDLDLVAYLIAGLALAVALVAGRSLGSILRTREVILMERAPGMLSAIDGVILAACVYLPVLRLVVTG